MNFFTNSNNEIGTKAREGISRVYGTIQMLILSCIQLFLPHFQATTPKI